MKYKGPFKTLGLHNDHTTHGRPELDYYGTPPSAVEWLLNYETFNKNVWEPCCGEGNISQTLLNHGYNVKSSDIHDYGYSSTVVSDFLEQEVVFDGDIITNPPYNNITPFVLQAYKLCKNKVAMLLKIQFLEGIQRHKEIFKEIPPSKIYVFTKRIECLRQGQKPKGSAICYCWVIWEKNNIYEPIIRWIPNYSEA